MLVTKKIDVIPEGIARWMRAGRNDGNAEDRKLFGGTYVYLLTDLRNHLLLFRDPLGRVLISEFRRALGITLSELGYLDGRPEEYSPHWPWVEPSEIRSKLLSQVVWLMNWCNDPEQVAHGEYQVFPKIDSLIETITEILQL